MRLLLLKWFRPKRYRRYRYCKNIRAMSWYRRKLFYHMRRTERAAFNNPILLNFQKGDIRNLVISTYGGTKDAAS